MTYAKGMHPTTCKCCQREDPAIRFWRKVDKNGPIHPTLGTACWLWTASKNHKGYGWFGYNRCKVYAHRRAWEMVNGAVPTGLFVLHRCDVRNCVNPAHLFLGTIQDNSDDMVAKGRHMSGTKKATECARGHAFSDENTYRYGSRRRCKICTRARQRIINRAIRQRARAS